MLNSGGCGDLFAVITLNARFVAASADADKAYNEGNDSKNSSNRSWANSRANIIRTGVVNIAAVSVVNIAAVSVVKIPSAKSDSKLYRWSI